MRCKGVKNNGDRCTREAKSNSKYCWQHQLDIEDAGGRRPKFETAAEMQKAIDDYFDSCFIKKETEDGKVYEKQIRPFTITGLAYSLGMTRRGLLDYEAKSEKFAHTITRAKTKIEMYAEEQLFRKKGGTHGIEFNLKNNFKWKDKQHKEISGPDGGAIEIDAKKQLEAAINKIAEREED